MVGAYGPSGSSTPWALTTWEYLPVFVACILASTPVCPFVKERLLAWVEDRAPQKVCEEGIANPRHLSTTTLATFNASPASSRRALVYRISSIACDVALVALLLASCASIVSGSFNPFIYFQF